MKILLIDVNCMYSSTGKIIFDLYNYYKTVGHDVKISYGRGPIINDIHIFRHSSRLEVYLHALRTRIFGYVGIGSELATKRLIKLIKNFMPDIVHLHTLHGYHLHVYKLLGFLKQKNIPTVYTFHDDWAFTGKCGQTRGCIKYTSICHHCPQTFEYPASFLFNHSKYELALKKKLFMNFSSITFTAVSEFLAKKAALSPIFADDAIKVVHNGLDIDTFHYQYDGDLRSMYADYHQSILLYITPRFLDKYKGGNYIVDLSKRLLNSGVVILLIGNTDGLIDYPTNIRNVGRISDQHLLAKYYSIADYTMMTSLTETFSMVCAESICCGTPIIGFEAGGPSEIAPDGYGCFVKQGDSDALYDVVMKYISGEKHFLSRSEIIDFGVHHFSREIMAKKYLRIYHR